MEETMNNETMNEVTVTTGTTPESMVSTKHSSALDVVLAIAIPAAGGFAAGMALHDPVDALVGTIVHGIKKVFHKRHKKVPVQTVDAEVVDSTKD